MIIKLNPVSGIKDTTISLNGLILTIDGIDYDLSVIPDGGQANAPIDSPVSGIVTREEVTITYEYDQSTSELNQPAIGLDLMWDTDTVFVDPIVRRV